ncbi:SpoIIE family protein phosphatase [Streptomyces sp. NBC_01221]|uniref:SpoIIE family protein phosphatase n=1 Tax=unclassified Streptomyces TaxID=2593676 RepID=UPI00224CE9F9|nr:MULTISPECIES: SpoIIE family protein phosphatase [unclassified Streptomyces]WSP60279.1 SpoIIE family protein phosphatase [Streptomyces sp. NBC_01241]WSU26331.1 SpoIIE family protein phosphatase [Streptomyces sp. NBC_01108]MCX4790443.1 SpoIIE family protein phosphatase [Streptomyces sp. NBC_01221]MCX4793831.1 SpoIIE family protein phosphatase [Streptomyces sp. NBC_01242]WSJ40905.1 SpoIIE family protein phosphatase [Streptomyces sp. NBC_01321]
MASAGPQSAPGAEPSQPSSPQHSFDAANDATAVVAGTGTVIGWTHSAQELLGYGAAEVVGRPAGFLLAMPGDPARVAGIAERCRTGVGWSGVATVRRRDGQRIEVDLRVSAAFHLDGNECFLVSGRERRPEWAVGQSVVDAFLTSSPIGIAVLDPQLRYVWLNDTLERIGGVPRAQRVGRGLAEVLPGMAADALETQMRRVLDTGVPVIDYEYRGWSWADPHRERAYSTSFFPLVEGDGTVTGLCYMVLDVTDRWKAQQRLALANDAGASIGSTLDVLRTAQELADFAVPRFADFVVVDLLEPVASPEEPGRWPLGPWPAGTWPAGAPARPMLRRAGMSSVREGCPEAIHRVGDLVDSVPPSHDVRFLREGEPLLVPVLDSVRRLWDVEQPARAATIREFGFHSLIAVPMRARDTMLGLTTFIRSVNLVPFEPDDVLPAREVVARAAVCVDNARRYTREHAAALTLQRSLLPHTLPGGMALDVASSYLPADAKDGVGGDWFDVIPLSGARVALVVGDVVGHGISAAATMGRLRTAVHTLADMDLPPDELLAHLDDLVLRLGDEEPDGEASGTTVLGATCLYAVYDPVTQLCTMARAGHPPPVVVFPDGRVSFPELPAGPPLGLGGMPFETAELTLPEGSLIGLYTNGLIEGRDRDVDLGMTRLGAALSQCGLSLDALCATVVDQLLPVPQPDDVALLLARTHELSADHVVSWEVPSDPAAVAGVRTRTARVLRTWGLEELEMTTELIVSELVTNAVRYAVGPIRLRLLRQSVLICEVSDASSTSPRLRHARTTDEGGRGLFLVAQLTRRWGTRYTPEGKIIWTEQELPGTMTRRPL